MTTKEVISVQRKVYPQPYNGETQNRLGQRELSAEVKSRVKTLDFADRLTGPLGLKRIKTRDGECWAGHCPIRPHPGRFRTFVVLPKEDRWWCSSCRAGGDVIDLAAKLNRCDRLTAAQLLAGIYLADARGA